VQALCEIGVPIVAREGVGGGYSLPPGYHLDPLPLTSDEAFLLLLALGTLERMADTPFAQARVTMMAKLRALLPDERLPEVEQLLATVGVDVPARAERAPLLEPLVAAAQQGSWIRISYQSAERRSTQHVLPRHVFAQNGYWYCRAYAFEHAAERIYRVDRIVALAPPDADFQPPPAPESLPYDHESHPQIVAALSPRGVAAVESEPHIGRQIQRQDDGSGHLIFRCPPAELDWFARYFASLGADVEVCAPAELRERIGQIGRTLVERYEHTILAESTKGTKVTNEK